MKISTGTVSLHFEIRNFEAEDLPFNMYMYVPECYPETHDIFFEREDEAKVSCIDICADILSEDY